MYASEMFCFGKMQVLVLKLANLGKFDSSCIPAFKFAITHCQVSSLLALSACLIACRHLVISKCVRVLQNLISVNLGEKPLLGGAQWTTIGRALSAHPNVRPAGGGAGRRVQGYRVRGAGYRVQVQGTWYRVQDAGYRVQGIGYRVQGAGCRVQGTVKHLGVRVLNASRCRVQSTWYRVQGAGYPAPCTLVDQHH